MAELIAESKPTARKTYDCMAWAWIVEGIDSSELEPQEAEVLEGARKKGYKILPGETYIRQTVRENGVPCTFRAIPELHAICLKYDLYLD